MSKKSRAARWAAAIAEARQALSDIDSSRDVLDTALSTIVELKEEYQEWFDGMPENLQSGATGEKLSAVIDLEDPTAESLFEAVDELETLLDELENVDLPNGFGRD